jgi:hypothetical protein
MPRDLTGSLMYGVGTSWMPLPERPMQSRSPARGFWGAGTLPPCGEDRRWDSETKPQLLSLNVAVKNSRTAFTVAWYAA